MLREELNITKARKRIESQREAIEENLYQLYQMDLIEQLAETIGYPAQFELPISYQGFYGCVIYDRIRIFDELDYIKIAKRLIKDLQDAGWNIDDKDVYKEDGRLYFYLSDQA